MGQRGEGQEDAGDHPAAAGGEPPGHHPHVEHGRQQAEGVGELPRHGGHQVAAVDVEGLVEDEQHGAGRGQRRPGEGQSTEPGHEPDRGREGHKTGDGDQLEGDAVGNGDDQHHGRSGRRPSRQASPPDQFPESAGGAGRQAAHPEPGHGHRGQASDDRDRQAHPGLDHYHQQRRDHHVEGEGREARVPVLGPAGEPQIPQQHVPQIGRGPHMGAQVAAGGGGVEEPSPGSQVADHEQGDPDHYHAGGDPADPVLGRVGTGDRTGRLRRPHACPADPVLGRVGVGHCASSDTTVTALKAAWDQRAGPSRPVRHVSSPWATPTASRAGNCTS